MYFFPEVLPTYLENLQHFMDNQEVLMMDWIIGSISLSLFIIEIHIHALFRHNSL